MSNRPRFTPEQVDYICYQIGDWYLKWKANITTGQHRLGIAKEELKSMICGNEYHEHVDDTPLKESIIKYLDEQIEDAEILKVQASGHNRENILGCLNALEDVKEFINSLDSTNV